jgi:hypothetical protein
VWIRHGKFYSYHNAPTSYFLPFLIGHTFGSSPLISHLDGLSNLQHIYQPTWCLTIILIQLTTTNSHNTKSIKSSRKKKKKESSPLIHIMPPFSYSSEDICKEIDRADMLNLNDMCLDKQLQEKAQLDT